MTQDFENELEQDEFNTTFEGYRTLGHDPVISVRTMAYDMFSICDEVRSLRLENMELRIQLKEARALQDSILKSQQEGFNKALTTMLSDEYIDRQKGNNE